MRGKTAWACSAIAFEASRNPLFPRLLRQVCVRAGAVCFWTALALERRAVEVWREQRAHAGSHRRGAHVLQSGLQNWLQSWAEAAKARLGWRAGLSIAVPAWSLPDSPKMRGLGLGSTWTVLCPYCDEFHTHSPGEGRRTPHCCGERDRHHYTLHYSGPLPVEHRTRFYRSSKSGLPRLLHRWPETGLHRSEAIGLLAA